MAEEFYIPKLGQTVEEVTIIKWLVEDGAKVVQGQEIVEVQTDKTIFPVEANAGGYLHIGPYEAGEVVPVLTVVATIGGPNDRFDRAPGQKTVVVEASSAGPAAAEIATLASPAPPKGQPTGARIFASPRARRLAGERHVDLAAVTPTGGNGVRVREGDVVAFLAHAALPVERDVVAEGPAGQRHAVTVGALTMEADAAAFVAMRDRLASGVEKEWGFAPDTTDLLLLLVGKALRRFPYMNARIKSEEVARLDEVNVAWTVETEAGETQVVLRDADRRGLHEIGLARRALEDRARRGTSLPEDLAGGTFTLSYLPEFDVNSYTPALRPPQAAALGIGRIAQRPFVREGQLVAWPAVTLGLSFDQRLRDGSPAARFLQYIKHSIEQPFLWLLY